MKDSAPVTCSSEPPILVIGTEVHFIAEAHNYYSMLVAHPLTKLGLI